MHKGHWTALYDKIYNEEMTKLKDHLKKLLIERTYETDTEILRLFNDHLTEQINTVIYKIDYNERKSLKFQEELINYYKGLKWSDSYEKPFLLDGFIEKDLPELRKRLSRQYDKTNTTQRNDHVYDLKFLNDSSPEEIIKLLAAYFAPFQMIDNKYKQIEGLKETIRKEKKLIKNNRFNGLEPTKVLDYMLQLTQINTENNLPFLTEETVYELTNMICKNKPVIEPVSVNISDQQRRQLEVFFIIFYKFCKDTLDAKGNRDKYISLLNRFIAQFQNRTIYANNFYLKNADQPLLIKVDAQYLRWMNA